MDSSLFHALKSAAEAAKEAAVYPTEAYDVATLELKYPHDVISVAPPTAKAPPLRPGETRATKLTDAVYAAIRRAQLGGPKGRVGCSIIVHEGVYVDAAGEILCLQTPERFSLKCFSHPNF